MVVVKVRETYDLHTIENKMTVIAIHTPKPDIIKKNYPGLLLQCKAYRPLKADVKIACASMLPLDPLGVGTEAGDVSPEDVFNPILYKAISNFGMSQLEARINAMQIDPVGAGVDIDGSTAAVDSDSVTTQTNEFGVYYGLLANTHEWKHAAAQQGLEMRGLRPLVWEMLYNVGDNPDASETDSNFMAPNATQTAHAFGARAIRGNAKPFPFINTTAYTFNPTSQTGYSASGFPSPVPANCELNVPWLNVICGVIIVPPSRLHSLFFRMVVEWDIEFSKIRSVGDITNWGGLAQLGTSQHYQDYSYESTKMAVTGDADSILDQDSSMVSSNVEINKVM